MAIRRIKNETRVTIAVLVISTALLFGCNKPTMPAATKPGILPADQEQALHICDALRNALIVDVGEAVKGKPEFDGFPLGERDSKLMKIMNCRNFDPT